MTMFQFVDIGEQHTVRSPSYQILTAAVYSSMSACDSMQAAITLTCMTRNSILK